MIRIAICEDNHIQQEILKDQIYDFRDKNGLDIEIDTFLNGLLLLEELDFVEGYDVYIMDIIMKGPKGNVVAKEIRDRGDKAPIIFYTATNVYADQVDDFAPAVYVLKTSGRAEFIERLKEIICPDK